MPFWRPPFTAMIATLPDLGSSDREDGLDAASRGNRAGAVGDRAADGRAGEVGGGQRVGDDLRAVDGVRRQLGAGHGAGREVGLPERVVDDLV